MKYYLMSIFIILNILSSTLYAADSYKKEHVKHESSFYGYNHSHEHVHNNSNHAHQHSHSSTSTNVFDFYVCYDEKQSTNLENKEKIFNIVYWLANSIPNSLFRPPIV